MHNGNISTWNEYYSLQSVLKANTLQKVKRPKTTTTEECLKNIKDKESVSAGVSLVSIDEAGIYKLRVNQMRNEPVKPIVLKNEGTII